MERELAALRQYVRTGELTIRGDTDGELARRIARYQQAHSLTFTQLARACFWPVTRSDRKHRNAVIAIVRRWRTGRGA